MLSVVVVDIRDPTTTISHNLFCIVSIIEIGSINTQCVGLCRVGLYILVGNPLVPEDKRQYALKWLE